MQSPSIQFPFPACFFLLAFLLVSVCAPGQSLPGPLRQTVDSTFRANYPASGPGCVVLIAQEGQPIFRGAYGLASVELNIPDSSGDVFGIGSLTKQFTAIALLQLQQAGKLSLSDDIRKYLPNYNTQGRIITIRNLLSHTSGIEDFVALPGFLENYTRDCLPKDQVALFETDTLLFQPGTDWSYSNSGYLLAGLILEKVSGLSYEDYLQKNIFTPLRMTHTYMGSHEKIIPNLAGGYDPADSSHMKPGIYFSWSWAYAEGGIVSTVDDMLRWDEALYSDKLLPPAVLQEAFTPYILKSGRNTFYGYGWVVNTDQGDMIFSHEGYIAGYRSVAIHIPSKHFYAVALSNSTRIHPGNLLMPLVLKATGLAQGP